MFTFKIVFFYVMTSVASGEQTEWTSEIGTPTSTYKDCNAFMNSEYLSTVIDNEGLIKSINSQGEFTLTIKSNCKEDIGWQ